MSTMHEMRKDPQTQPAWWLSASAGTAAAAALVALIAPVVLWANRSPQDFLPGVPIPFLTISASAIGGVVLLVLAVRDKAMRTDWGPTIAALAVIIAMVVAGLCIKNAAPLVPEGGWLPMVDTTGSAGVAVFAVIAAVIALVMLLPAGLSTRPMGPRVLLCVFVVAALFFSSWGYNVVEAYRQSVWNPALTAAATPAAPLPEVVGPIGYRIAVRPFNNNRPGRAGNGFLHVQGDLLTAYDGPTGDIRWQVDLSRKTRLLVISGSNDAGDSVGIVVLVQKGALVALESSSGNVLWRRHYDGDPDLVTGTVDALAFIEVDDRKRIEGDDRKRGFLRSVDPVTGQLRWSKPFTKTQTPSPSANPPNENICYPTYIARGLPGQLLITCRSGRNIIDARTGAIAETRIGAGIPDPNDRFLGSDVYVFFSAPEKATPQWKPKPSDTTFVVDRDGTIIDQIAGAKPLSAAHDGFLLLITPDGTLLMRDYRSQTTTQVPLDLTVNRRSLQNIATDWLSSNRLAVAQMEHKGDIEPPVYLIDAAHADAQPAATEAPCYSDEQITDLEAVPGAVVVSCKGRSFRWSGLVGLIPPQPS